jgi:pectate lyase
MKLQTNHFISIKHFAQYSIASLFLPVYLLAQLAAFPGAEGFGSFATGGRGGRVIEVTNTNDSGPGSLRAACEAKGSRTVVFRVSGTIDLKTPIEITEPYLTIAGQTAPGDGICLKRSQFEVYTHNVIVRFLRSRPGNISGQEMDAMGIGRNAHNVIFDHCSATWSVDECLSPTGSISNITVQWCLIGEALNKSVHHKGAHGYGSLVRAVGGVTLHHNLWVNNIARNPRLGDCYGRGTWPTFDVRNNVIYNWGAVCSGMAGDHFNANYVGNYLRPGPNSSKKAPIVLTDTAQLNYYVQGNIVEGKPEYVKYPLSMFRTAGGAGKIGVTIVNKPFAVVPVHTTSAEKAYNEILIKVGAVFPARDSADTRIIREVISNTGRIIDSQNDVGGWPMLNSLPAPVDSDHDGIPDEWETAHGLNPNDPEDANKKNNYGYTILEVYLNSLVSSVIGK